MRRKHDPVLVKRRQPDPDQHAETRKNGSEPLPRKHEQRNGDERVPHAHGILHHEQPAAQQQPCRGIQIAGTGSVLIEGVPENHTAGAEIEDLTQLVAVVRHVDEAGLVPSRREQQGDREGQARKRNGDRRIGGRQTPGLDRPAVHRDERPLFRSRRVFVLPKERDR